MASRSAIARRRTAIIERCADDDDGASIEDLRRALRGTAPRTIQKDCRWLRERFPERFRSCGRRWQWQGPVPQLLGHELQHLDRLELLALVIARGLLRDPGRGHCEASQARYDGPLDGALDDLLRRCGLDEEAAAISPDTIQVDRHGAESCAATNIVSILDAFQSRCCVRGHYRNLDGQEHPVHLLPLRLILLNGEYLLLANDGRRTPPVKAYRVSRLQGLSPTISRPPQAPGHIDRITIDCFRDAAFGATASLDPGQRRRIVLAISPAAWPRITGRHFGANQRIDDAPADLPPGWKRLAFTTTGLAEARHWVLAFGPTVIAEAPPELCDWLGEQAAQLSHIYGPQTRRKNGAQG